MATAIEYGHPFDAGTPRIVLLEPGKFTTREIFAEEARIRNVAITGRNHYESLRQGQAKAATQQDRGHFFSPGLVIGVNHQRMAEAMRVKISRSDLLGQSVFVLVH